jgi:flagella basal body P-ring formation protein FlgA
MRSLLTVFAFAAAAALPLSAAAPSAEVAATGAGPLAREEFVARLTRELTTRFNLEGELQLEFLRPWTAPARVASSWTVSVVEYPPVPSASMLLRCKILADNLQVADQTLVVRASHWREVWAAVQPLSAGAPFETTVLEARRVDLFRERDVVPVTVGDRSYVFARALAAGRLLTWRDIARRPLVKKGNVVEVSAADGMLVVTLKALAMENGARGDTVTVRNPESQKNFAAVVVDENRVQVRF